MVVLATGVAIGVRSATPRAAKNGLLTANSKDFSAMQRKRKLKGKMARPSVHRHLRAGVRLCQTEPAASVAERV